MTCSVINTRLTIFIQAYILFFALLAVIIASVCPTVFAALICCLIMEARQCVIFELLHVLLTLN